MLEINEDKINDFKNDLKYYRGWLPFQFIPYISLSNRKVFLKSAGLWDKVNQRNLEVMQGIRDNEPHSDVYLDSLLKSWIMENPKFKDLVIFD